MQRKPYSTVEIYRCEAYGISPYDVARRFASTYFHEPRDIDWFRSNGNELRFSLVDGIAVYTIRLEEGEKFKSVSVYVIERQNS